MAGADAAGAVGLALAAAAGPTVTEGLSDFLVEQQQLARTQREVADRQARLLEHRIERAGLEKEHLAAQNLHLRMQHIHDRLRLVLDAGLAVLGIALLVGIGWTVYGAVTDRSIVVNAFTVAPRLESTGQSGAIVAAQFLDELIRLRESARTDLAKRAVIDSLEERVQIELPELRVSFGELRRVLHEAVGHRSQIRGELMESTDGLALTLRGTKLPSRTFIGKPEELPALVTRAAEYVYGYTDPVLMAYYLQRAGRLDATIALIRSRFASVPPATQSILLNVWGSTLFNAGDRPGAVAKYRAAIALNPSFWYPYENLIAFLAMGGREEEAAQVGREFEQAAGRHRWLGTRASETDFVDLDALRLDLAGAIRAARIDYDTSGGTGTGGWPAGAIIGQYYALQHDAAASDLFLETNPDASAGAGSLFGESSVIEAAAARGIVAFDLGRYQDAAQYWDEWSQRRATFSSKSAILLERFPRERCWLPIVYEMAGRRLDADAAITRTQGVTNVDCFRFRGDMHDHRGEWAEAERAYADGVARAPSLPHAYFSSGTALLRHQQYSAAIDKLTAAHARSPRWADPLDAWAQALVKLGQPRQAVKKYAEAVGYAPNWGALHLHWGEALDRLGDRAMAIEQFRKAEGLALSDADRLTVAHYLSTATR